MLNYYAGDLDQYLSRRFALVVALDYFWVVEDEGAVVVISLHAIAVVVGSERRCEECFDREAVGKKAGIRVRGGCITLLWSVRREWLHVGLVS